MARTPVNATVRNGATYTVPAGKMFQGKAFALDLGDYVTVRIAGKSIAVIGGSASGTTVLPASPSAGPLQANAGEAFSASQLPNGNPGEYGLSGFLIDV